MWIERVELQGFGNLTGEKIQFRADKLNLVLEPNEHGKSTIAEAIWAVLYDYAPSQRSSENKLKERDARKPLSGGAFKACIDLVHKNRQLRVVRDFNERSVRVFDRGAGDVEVTSEFLSGPNRDDIGVHLTGMPRELFRRTCFVGQRELSDYGFAGDLDLSSLLQSIADGSGSATTSATAIGVLDDALLHFPYMGKKYKVDRLLSELDERRRELLNRVKELEGDKGKAGDDHARLSEIEEQIAARDKKIKSAEYFHQCLEAADLDGRLMKAQERLLKVADLKRQLAALAHLNEFPIERYRRVQELWTTRVARLGDFERFKSELNSKEKHIQARDLEIRERWEGITTFSADDAQMIASTARSLQTVLGELEEAEHKRKNELEQVKIESVDLEKLANVRKALLSLEARDIDDAYAYNAMVNSAKEQISECERSVWRGRMIQQEIVEQRKNRKAAYKNVTITLAFLVAIMLGVGAATFAVLKLQISFWTSIFGSVVILGFIAALVVNFLFMLKASSYRFSDYNKARDDEQKQAQLGQDLHNKIMGLEIRLEDLARKAGVTNGAELVRNIQSYATAAPRLKDLDLLEQLVLSRQTHVIRLRGELEAYFEKAGRKAEEATPDNALKLADEINAYREELRALQATAGLLDHKSSEASFLQDQLKDLDAELRHSFQQAKLENLDDVEQAYKEFLETAQSYRRWEGLKTELERIEQDTTSDLVPDQLPRIIERLQIQRDAAWAAMQDIVARFPDIAETTPPGVNPADANQTGELSALKSELEALRREADELAVSVRSVTREYDQHYVEALEAVEEIDEEIDRIKRAKVALELARDTFKRLADETHVHWSARLNEIAKAMLDSLATEYEELHFDSELKLTARRRGQSEPLQAANIKGQLSAGTREQLHWLARMAVSRYLSHMDPLPIVLDEPFSESDDDRFIKIMRFLLDTMLKQHQIILFTCHEARQEWLLEQLEPAQRDLIQTCRLEPTTVKTQ